MCFVGQGIMAPVDKSTDGSDSDKSGITQPTEDKNGNKTVGTLSGQGLDKSARQGSPVLDDSSTISSKSDDTVSS